MGGYGIVGGNLPIAAGHRARQRLRGTRRGDAVHVRRRRLQPGHVRRDAQPRRAVAAAGRVHGHQQPVRHGHRAAAATRRSPTCSARARASACPGRSFLEVSEFEIAERTVDSRHQQIVVVGVAMADRSNHRERDRLRVARSGGGGAADPAAASLRGVRGDLLASLRGACGEEARDLASELRAGRRRLHSLASPPRVRAAVPARPRLPDTRPRPRLSRPPRSARPAARNAGDSTEAHDDG